MASSISPFYFFPFSASPSSIENTHTFTFSDNKTYKTSQMHPEMLLDFYQWDPPMTGPLGKIYRRGSTHHSHWLCAICLFFICTFFEDHEWFLFWSDYSQTVCLHCLIKTQRIATKWHTSCHPFNSTKVPSRISYCINFSSFLINIGTVYVDK